MEGSVIGISMWGGLALGVALGIVVQSSRFCVRAAFANAFERKDNAQLRAYLLAVAVVLLGTQGLSLLGKVDLSSTVYLRPSIPLVGLMIGGLIFGAGMILARGCPSRIIVRAAEGQGGALLTWLVFVLAIMASFEGALAPVREALTGPVITLPFSTLPGLLGGLPAWIVTAALVVLISVFLLVAPRKSEWWGWKWPVAGALVGALVAASWYVSIAGSGEFDTPEPLPLGFVAAAQDFMRYLTMERLGFALKFGSASVLGLFLGAFISALVTRQFRWEMPNGAQMLRNLMGGVMMALGGILAMGCTIGQGMAGVGTLSLSSFIAIACIALGAWVANRLQALTSQDEAAACS